MKSTFRKTAIFALLMVYLVITAGAVVRMTGSGMGCPDWPKCFGYYIPPTDISQLQWQPEHPYREGQVIIHSDSLLVAGDDFVSGQAFDLKNWARYARHDYAEFNAIHTWTEFINRLLGALAGVATLVLACYSLSFWKIDKPATILSWIVVLAMGFQAWLGATVVFSELEPLKITTHMVMALVIVALLLYIVHAAGRGTATRKYDPLTMRWLCIALALTLIQVILGTQVRQFVDEQVKSLGEHTQELWLREPRLNFYVHRSFSLAVVLVNVFLAYRVQRLKLGFRKIYWVIPLIVIEIICGAAMQYLHFPFGSQAVHLVLATVIFGIQLYVVWEILDAAGSRKTL